MATQHLTNPTFGTLPRPQFSSAILRSGCAAPLKLFLPAQPGAEVQEQVLPLPAEVECNRIGRCLRWALAIEGGAALLIYALWTLLHLKA